MKYFLILISLFKLTLANKTDFVFDLAKSKPTTIGLGGESRSANIASMPVLKDQRVSNVLFHIEACGVNQHNIHPRSAELLYVISGRFRVAFVEENNGRVLVNTVIKGQVTLFPRGLMHQVVNIGCTNGSFMSVFGHEDPGVLQVASRLFHLSEQVLTSTFHIELKSGINDMKSRIQENPSNGYDSECLIRCKIKNS